MVKLKLLVFVLIKTANCAFFDLTDVEDPLSLLWQHPKDFSLPTTSSSACIVPIPGTGRVIPGQCKHKTLCLLSGGQTNNNGNCGNFLTCCTKSTTCSHRTKSKVSYFSNDISNFVTDCEHTVEIYNDNVCQVRLDFEQFNFSPATSVSTNDPRTCLSEYMTVTPGIYNVPQFCGFNTGQHAYIHLNGQKEVKLRVNFGTENVDRIPSWRIRITQLECPGRRNWLGKHIFGYTTDFPLIAPEGVTQYFTEPSGRVKSFGFNGVDEYISGLYYAIAFKRTPSFNCIRFTIIAETFATSTGTGQTPVSVCQDYLFIPDVRDDSNNEVTEDKICQLIPGTTFHSTVPGPFYMYFRSSLENQGTPDSQIGFDLQYQLTTCPTDSK